MPKKDVLKKLKKRVFVVKNIKEFKSAFSSSDNNNLKNDNTFLNNFFRLKQDCLEEEKYKKIIYGN